MTNRTERLTALVIEALRNAAENGVTFAGWSNAEIAVDMMDYDADIADMGPTTQDFESDRLWVTELAEIVKAVRS